MSDMKNNHNDDLQALLAMLDQMEKKPAPVVEERKSVIIDMENSVPVEDDEAFIVDNEEAELPIVMLADLLITPDQQDDDEDFVPLEKEPTPEEEDEPLPPAPRVSTNPLPALLSLLPNKKDDSILRGVKIGSLVMAVVAVLVSLVLVLEIVVRPWHNQRYNDKLADWYHTANASGVTRPNFPEDMRIAFNKLYRANEDVRGWLTFRSQDSGHLVNIDYPVVQTDDNETYRNVDLHGRKSRFGTLFFDKDSRIEEDNPGSALVIYGNTDGSGQMMSSLNHLVGSAQNARLATHFTLSNLYAEQEYVVFAVLILDDEEPFKENRLELRNQFASSADFLNYVSALQKRSLFKYPVSVIDTDRLVLLTTELPKDSYGLEKGRVVVVARRRRDGEMTMNTGIVEKKLDSLMPYRWYTHQGLTVPQVYYESMYTPPLNSIVTAPPDEMTSSTGSDSTTLATDLWGDTMMPTTDYDSTVTQESTEIPSDYTEPTRTTLPPQTWEPEITEETREGITTTPDEATRTTRDISAITGPNNNKNDD